jgi:fructose-1,6-bisphosphatase I
MMNDNIRNIGFPGHDHPRIITIERHILEAQRTHPEATGVLTSLLYDLALAGKFIASRTTRAGLAEILGSTQEVNVQGEQVMRLDRLADQTIYRLNDHTGRLAVMASEEHADIVPDARQNIPPGKYVLLYDPLDGSSNIDYNASIGTIFSIYRRRL